MIDMLTSGTIAIPAWCFPSKKPLLDRGEVHLWQAQLDALATYLERFEDSLSSDERQRAEEFKFQKDRVRYIVRRGLLRSILSFYTEIAPRRLHFVYSPTGKPELSPTFDEGTLRFNVSHARGLPL